MVGDLTMHKIDQEWTEYWRQAIQETSNEIKKEKDTTSSSTRYRIRYQPEDKWEPASSKKTGPHFAPVLKRPVSSSASYGNVPPTISPCELDDEANC